MWFLVRNKNNNKVPESSKNKQKSVKIKKETHKTDFLADLSSAISSETRKFLSFKT